MSHAWTLEENETIHKASSEDLPADMGQSNDTLTDEEIQALLEESD